MNCYIPMYVTKESDLSAPSFYLRKVMTKLCTKILVEADSAIEAAFPLVQVLQ